MNHLFQIMCIIIYYENLVNILRILSDFLSLTAYQSEAGETSLIERMQLGLDS